ncbi:hypothetical protein EB796_003701 [Bugula neritina]|uniref:Uncharacterized protein n=1 Tax=Bugula neritina TaxID=10212 RepID=A0A7J7KHE3_BUGNE|nr:hypothetical protein EB796_003701 [Bugula neritina]
MSLVVVSRWLHLSITLRMGSCTCNRNAWLPLRSNYQMRHVITEFNKLRGCPAPPPLLLVDEPTSTKKERALAKKRLKQQQQQQKKQKPSNGHVSMKTVEKAKTDAPETVKPVTVGKKSAKTANHENKVKVELKVTVAKDAKKEEELAAARLEKALMKKEAQQGDWVTVLSNKDKKAKQAQSVSNMAEQLAEESRQAIIEEARRLTEKAEAAKLLSSQQVKEKKEAVKSNSKDSNNKAPKPSKEAKSKTVQTSSTEAKPVSDAASNVPVTSGVVAKEPSSSNDSKVKVTEPGSKSEEQLSLEKNLEDAMQPAFNEFGDWEEAKPMKMKNVKKRARREK